MANNQVTEISLFQSKGQPDGKGRIWQDRNQFAWAHPDGSEGRETTFGSAVKSLEEISESAE